MDIMDAINASGPNKTYATERARDGLMDMELHSRLNKPDVTRQYLESYEAQKNIVKLFASPATLKTILDEPYEEAIDPVETTRAYLAGDDEYFERANAKAMISQPDVYDQILTKRNFEWLPVLENLIESPGRHLIAVGLMHLFSDDGLLHLLRDRGYTVTRFETPPLSTN